MPQCLPSVALCPIQKGEAACEGGSKPQEAAQDAASSVKAAIPDEPKEAAKDALSSAKDSLPEAPSNPFQSFFSGKPASSACSHTPLEQV